MLEEKDDRKCGCENNIQQIVNSEDMQNNNMSCPRNCEREKMIMQIRELDFAVEDLALYLDTHPEDQKALCLHRHYTRELKDLKDKYQKVYGPLTIYYPCNKWRWLEEPWPWKRGNY